MKLKYKKLKTLRLFSPGGREKDLYFGVPNILIPTAPLWNFLVPKNARNKTKLGSYLLYMPDT